MFTWLWQKLQSARQSPGEGQAHMTFGQTSVGRSITRTGVFLKKQLWIWPIVAVVLLAAIGYGIRVAIERTMQGSLASELQTLLNIERSMLETWLKIQEANAQAMANAPQVRQTVAQIVAAHQPLNADSDTAPTESGAVPPVPATAPAPSLAKLRTLLAQELSPGMTAHNFVGFVLADKEQRILASTSIEFVGQTVPEFEALLGRVLDGETIVTPPFASRTLIKDDRGRVRTGVPTMFVVAPVRDANLQVIAALGMRIRPEREFTRILHLGQPGETGETYAINKDGLLVSNSRFDEELILVGLLPDLDDAQSILTLSARDPGGNVTQGFRPKVRRAELPLTKSAAAAVAGESGIDLVGYNDYRGVPVVGAWQWLPKYELGLITEIDHAEAYRPLSILRWAFFSMLGLLAASSVVIFVFTIYLARAQREAQKAAIEARQLGQYRLEERLGAGAMGVVYKGHHAMLRRQTAIKMLNVDKVNDASIARFEREVQITCKLNNPSTVAIYDYGRTPEGVFYYAMEYLDGIDLQVLVERYGPQPEGRVIRILKQVCSSLFEAHSQGLVHRDIKPANIMLNRRGGEPDVVKVLDFGLVKALDDEKQSLQSGGALSGTPLYMSPEAIQTPDLVDARSDLYAVGAVGYFLLTGQPVFQAASLVELCGQHVAAMPTAPSERLGRTISLELESALLACLEKSRAKRPQTARDLSLLLDRAQAAATWTLDDAEAWWGRHERSQAASAAGSNASENNTSTASKSPGNVSGGSVASGAGAGDASAGSQSTGVGTSGGRTDSSGFDRTIDGS
jgi:eukaryotic-like serine/threonine-protein kinase